MSSRAAKGKGKAKVASERSPLLGGPSAFSPGDFAAQTDALIPPSRPSSRTRSTVYTVAVILFSLFFAAALLLALLAASFRPSDEESAALPQAFKYDKPSVDVLDVSEGGVRVNVSFLCGIDIDRVLAVDGSRAEHGAQWWESLRRFAAHRTVDALPTQAVQVTVPEVLVYSQGPGGPALLNLSLATPLFVPLVRGQLQPVWFEAVGSPVASVGELWDWARQVWADGEASVEVRARSARAIIPGAWWSKYTAVDKDDVMIRIDVPVPRLPNFPPPGRPLNMTELVVLRDYSFTSSNSALRLTATASLPNPGVKDVPFDLPFAIGLGNMTIAQVVARAESVNDAFIELAIQGDVTSLASGPALSSFLQRYLDGEDNPIVVRGMASMREGDSKRPPPDWVLRSLPSLTLDLVFPGPAPKPQIIRSVSIEGMKLAESAGKMTASGTVIALVELPLNMAGVNINVTAIRPDVLVFDGAVDDDDDDDGDDPDDQPNRPPPARAFGHIHPDEYIPSTTEPSPDPATPNGLVVRAPFTDLPLDILPGRDPVLSSFVTKVLFKGGAVAGIDGQADVHANLAGLEGGGDLEIDSLPVRGEFWVGKARLGWGGLDPKS